MWHYCIRSTLRRNRQVISGILWPFKVATHSQMHADMETEIALSTHRSRVHCGTVTSLLAVTHWGRWKCTTGKWRTGKCVTGNCRTWKMKCADERRISEHQIYANIVIRITNPGHWLPLGHCAPGRCIGGARGLLPMPSPSPTTAPALNAVGYCWNIFLVCFEFLFSVLCCMCSHSKLIFYLVYHMFRHSLTEQWYSGQGCSELLFAVN